jgi:hypothetical protein
MIDEMMASSETFVHRDCVSTENRGGSPTRKPERIGTGATELVVAQHSALAQPMAANGS